MGFGGSGLRPAGAGFKVFELLASLRLADFRQHRARVFQFCRDSAWEGTPNLERHRKVRVNLGCTGMFLMSGKKALGTSVVAVPTTSYDSEFRA